MRITITAIENGWLVQGGFKDQREPSITAFSYWNLEAEKEKTMLRMMGFVKRLLTAEGGK